MEKKKSARGNSRKGLGEFSKIALKLAESEAELRDLVEYFNEHREALSRAEREKLEAETEKLIGYVSNGGQLLEELENFRDRMAMHRRLTEENGEG